jgi:hypothetical protein
MSCRSVVGHDLLSQTCMSVASPTGPRRLRSARALLCSGSGWLVVQSELRTVLGARGTHHLGAVCSLPPWRGHPAGSGSHGNKTSQHLHSGIHHLYQSAVHLPSH